MMKSIHKNLSLLGCLAIGFSFISQEETRAMPSSRKLPPHTVEGGTPFILMRDHLVTHDLYILPKQMKVISQSLTPLPGVDPDCSPVQSYQKILRELTEAYEHIAETEKQEAGRKVEKQK